jgi:hypothetical protein
MNTGRVAIGVTKPQVNGSMAYDRNWKYGDGHGSIPWRPTNIIEQADKPEGKG